MTYLRSYPLQLCKEDLGSLKKRTLFVGLYIPFFNVVSTVLPLDVLVSFTDIPIHAICQYDILLAFFVCGWRKPWKIQQPTIVINSVDIFLWTPEQEKIYYSLPI